MEAVKNLFLFRWYYSPPQELEEASISHASQIEARKMEFLEKEIPLPEELFRFGASQPVFNVLCEDAIMFYTVRFSSIRTSLI